MGCLCEPEKLKPTIVKFSDKIIDMEIIFPLFVLAMYLLWYNQAKDFYKEKGTLSV